MNSHADPNNLEEVPLTPRDGHRRRWLLRSAMVAGPLAITLTVAAGILAATYQPVAFGGSFGLQGGNGIFRPLPAQINAFPGARSYIPPQKKRAHIAVLVSLTNNGPRAVTLVSVGLYPPGLPAVGKAFRTLRRDGAATYSRDPAMPGPRSPRLAGLSLGSGQSINVRIPLVTARCMLRNNGYTAYSSFWVTTKYLLWTHRTQISWIDSSVNPDAPYDGAIVASEGELPAVHGVVCAR